jgi:hypothetical protein
VRDVLPPAGRVTARRDTVCNAPRDGRRGIIVRHVAVRRHVPCLPDRGGPQRRRLGQRANSQAGAVLIDGCDDFGCEVGSDRAPTRSRRAIAERCGRAAVAAGSEDSQGREGGNG